MRRRTILVAALALAVGLPGCGGSDDGPSPVPRTACHYGRYCNEYEGRLLDVSSTNASCTQDGATAMSVCPAEGVLGLCTRLRDGITIRDYCYDAADVNATRTMCIALGDTWTTP
jgi:hypothetical protein